MATKRGKSAVARKSVSYKTKTSARKKARSLGLKGIHSHGRGKNKIYMPGSTHSAYERALKRKKNGSKKKATRRY